jgi:hypothetical protein
MHGDFASGVPVSFAIIRRVNVLRFLFGMRPMARSVQPTSMAVPVPQTGEIRTY